jgi:transposase
MEQVKSGKIKKQYSDEFKRDAVALLRSSNRPIKQVAVEIGVSDSVLGCWARKEEKVSLDSQMTEAEKLEAVRLRKQIKDLKEEIEILKRFTTYWVSDQK